MKELHEITLLIDFYGELITKKKLSNIKKYYFEDLSLSEIAKINNVSKNAIYDSIKSTLLELRNYEKKLKLIYKRELRLKIYNEINDSIIIKKLMDIDKV